jgi:amino acid transporter
MESKINKKQAVLLPKYFKIIGLVVMILAFVTAMAVKAMNIEMLQSQKELFRVFTLNAFIVGLLFVAWSRDKVEDEMTIAIRLKSMAFTFSWAVFYVIVKPIVDLLFKDPIQDLTGQQVVMSMLFVYLIIYYVQKIGR